ncbi:uncharacterized protein LOC127718053 isoform X3 [Mytilus californianus]|uniref:uncharacterized protein LOC127718053 isoform X3 n=1 Tax=Mytilus californianus TaxID=6549 RepID=UPI0022479590|nr:uncharacterized protein LOC127718053 isoform X3 [Mytilus californianus]
MPFLHNISFILFLIEINAEVSLKMTKDTISFGNYIVLTCTVHGIQTIDITTTRQWSMGDDDKLLCYNGRINNLRKYKEKVLPRYEFSLTIFNVTESDLNVVYQCRYGFDAASKLIEADEYKLFLSLKMRKDSIMFGGYIILTCTVNGLSTVDRDVTRQWSMGNHDELLSYNGRINNHRKYEETILQGNEFSLKIINVTEKDVNITYRCRYGFDTATYFIEINESVSLQKRVPSYHSFNISSHSAAGQTEEGNFKVNHVNDTIKYDKGNIKTKVILLSTLIPLATCILVLVGVLVFVKRKHILKETKDKNHINNIMERENLCTSSEGECISKKENSQTEAKV